MWNALLSFASTATSRWKTDLSTQWTTGSEKDPSQVYVKCQIQDAVYIKKPIPSILNSSVVDLSVFDCFTASSPTTTTAAVPISTSAVTVHSPVTADTKQSVARLAGQKWERVVLLEMIYVPEKQRRQGIATAIVDVLEARANKELGYRLAIGPVFDQTIALERIASKRKYIVVHPFSFIQPALAIVK